MTRIHILNDELISQIAAGEVIERPASALKEILENSLDAGSTQISIEVENGGLKQIRVVDNGCGISFEDAPMAFERHATSKLSSLNDLFQIKSLGFRGEALASIASIANVELFSRQEGKRTGVHYIIDGGKMKVHEISGCPKGTDISVRGLFKHTPARRKYMKSESREYLHILKMISHMALAHPQVGFRLMKDASKVFDLPSQTLEERIRSLYGGDTLQALIPVRYHQSNLIIKGFVGKPELARRSKKYQFIFLNGRCIESRLINHAVKEAFHSLLMHEKYPWFLLNIYMDPQLLDVNVHPRKTEVKFVNQQEMYRAVRGSLYHALQSNSLSPSMNLLESSANTFTSQRYFQSKPNLQLALDKDMASENIFTIGDMKIRPIAQVALSYIVAESEEGMVLIDQHAAHERIRYARLMEALEKESPLKQSLFTPLEIDMGIEAIKLIEEYGDTLSKIGFEIESFGEKSFILRAVPAGLGKGKPESLLKDILTDIAETWKQNHSKNLKEFLLTFTACRGAIKFGDTLSLIQMQALVRDMENTSHCEHCPHGRPAMIKLSFDQLESLFKRKNF